MLQKENLLYFTKWARTLSLINLHKAPALVQISYRYFYRPILGWVMFLAGVNNASGEGGAVLLVAAHWGLPFVGDGLNAAALRFPAANWG